jgi:hypothetical protein
MDWSFKLNYASLASSPAGTGMALNHIASFYYHPLFVRPGTAHLSLLPTVFASSYDNRIIFSDFHFTRPQEPRILF